ncbi:MAG: UDP-N-acetylmuramoyl-L-alanine--D-glutamate ligase, partial [Clostridia bacterium]|nr:UDP-N-acetylmuramoyl-L-alanine--D-glutamate ligase [Clostridia bacterium]
RLENAGRAVGKRWIDDSKSTNVSSCLAAVEATAGRICLITGGRDKGLDFAELFGALPEKATDVIAMGECAVKIEQAA